MGLIQASRQGTGGGGGGGLEITGWKIDEYEQTTNFNSGDVVLALSQTPITPQAIVVDYNGQRLLYGIGFSYASGDVTILVDDPYVEEADAPPIFQIQYPY